MAAVNIGKTETALGAFCRRLGARIGNAKAVTATTRRLAVLFYNALRFGLQYADPGANYYDERYKAARAVQPPAPGAADGFLLIKEEAHPRLGVS